MASTIVSRIISSSEDKRMSIGNNQFFRRMDIGSAWNVLRVGVRMTVNATASITGTPVFYIGVCHYNGGRVASETTANFVGIVSTSATWTYTAGTPSYLNPSLSGVVRVNTTNTTASGSLSVFTATPAAYRFVVYVTIDKTTPASTAISCYRPNNAVTGIHDVDQTTFLEQIQEASPSISIGYATEAFTTLAVDEAANGALDAINIAWDRTVVPVEFSDVAYWMFS